MVMAGPKGSMAARGVPAILENGRVS